MVRSSKLTKAMCQAEELYYALKADACLTFDIPSKGHHSRTSPPVVQKSSLVLFDDLDSSLTEYPTTCPTESPRSYTDISNNGCDRLDAACINLAAVASINTCICPRPFDRFLKPEEVRKAA